jgi:hypothetical protein
VAVAVAEAAVAVALVAAGAAAAVGICSAAAAVQWAWHWAATAATAAMGGSEVLEGWAASSVRRASRKDSAAGLEDWVTKEKNVILANSPKKSEKKIVCIKWTKNLYLLPIKINFNPLRISKKIPINHY